MLLSNIVNGWPMTSRIKMEFGKRTLSGWLYHIHTNSVPLKYDVNFPLGTPKQNAHEYRSINLPILPSIMNIAIYLCCSIEESSDAVNISSCSSSTSPTVRLNLQCPMQPIETLFIYVKRYRH